MPAIFTVISSGSLRPATVSVPRSVPIDLTVVSRDGRSHTAVLRSPSPRSLKIAAGGRVSVLISGLRPGRYPLELDGNYRGTLVVGVAPGP